MATATLNELVTTSSVPPYIIGDWECATDSTGIIEISLPAMNNSSYINEPQSLNTGSAYAIRLVLLAISCDSPDFDLSVLNKNDETLVDTVYELINYININKSIVDNDLTEFIIRNFDDALTNKLYIVYTNNSGTPMGTLKIQMTYVAVQNGIFTNILHG